MDISIIKQSFKCCGISTNLDGSEENLLFNYDSLLNQEDNNNDEVAEDSNPEEYLEEVGYKNNWNI